MAERRNLAISLWEKTRREPTSPPVWRISWVHFHAALWSVPSTRQLLRKLVVFFPYSHIPIHNLQFTVSFNQLPLLQAAESSAEQSHMWLARTSAWLCQSLEFLSNGSTCFVVPWRLWGILCVKRYDSFDSCSLRIPYVHVASIIASIPSHHPPFCFHILSSFIGLVSMLAVSTASPLVTHASSTLPSFAIASTCQTLVKVRFFVFFSSLFQ